MSNKTISVYPLIKSIKVDEDAGKLIDLTLAYETEKEYLWELKEGVVTVREYEKLGFYPLKKPDFVNNLVIELTTVALSKNEVMGDTSHQTIEGNKEAVRAFQLPGDIQNQIRDKLIGFDITYNPDTWEIISVTKTTE
ncbi:MAG: hypothetical protein EBU19_02485 [Gammaproteobacteria bacterium]|jgi:hypothetical protein|nr:hypothetical protein [Gammaproteobacteria bacterium]